MAKRKKTIDEQVRDGLTELAFGKITDAVSLLFEDEDTILKKLPKLKLSNVSEIKRPKGGGMEIKFFDRIKALEKLGELTTEKSNQDLSFYEALEKGAENVKSVFDNND